MSNVAQIKRQDRAAEERDPLRAELDAAQKMHWKAVTAVTAATDALRRGRDLVAQAEAKVEAATAAVGEARAVDAKNAAKAVKMRSDISALGGTKQARRDLEDCTDALEIAREACARLEADLADQQIEVLHRQNAVLACRNACIAPVIVAVIERTRAARLTLAVSRALASALLVGHDRGPEFPDEMATFRARDARLAPLAGLAAEAERLLMLAGSTPEEQSAAASAAAAMKQAVLELTADASVEIPLP